MIDELNSRFGLDSIRFSEGQGGLPKAILTTIHSKAEVYLHGAHVTRFDLDEQPVLWMSKDAVFDGKKALRGGIPIIFLGLDHIQRTTKSLNTALHEIDSGKC